MSFYQIYGHRLEELIIKRRNEEDNEEIKEFLRFCPNITNIFVAKFPLVLNESKVFLPKLKHINKTFDIGFEDMNELKILADKYSKTLNRLDVEFDFLFDEELNTCVDCICRLEKLKVLSRGRE